MISVVYVTNRPVNCIGTYDPALKQFVPAAQPNQYVHLSESLACQTLPPGLWELVVVDKANELPRPELAWCGDRVRYVRHRQTPWGDVFAPAIPRNDGLREAQGDIVFGLDDAVSFGPELLAAVLRYATAGRWLAPLWSTHDVPRASGPVVAQERCGGILAYPRALAIAQGGHEERFAGTEGLEDWNFSLRMTRAGCRFICDPSPGLRVTTHPTGKRHRLGLSRCCYAVDALVTGQPRANQPWTPEELACFSGPVCSFAVGAHCKLLGGPSGKNRAALRPCHRPERPSAETLAIMTNYESHPFSSFEVAV